MMSHTSAHRLDVALAAGHKWFSLQIFSPFHLLLLLMAVEYHPVPASSICCDLGVVSTPAITSFYGIWGRTAL